MPGIKLQIGNVVIGIKSAYPLEQSVSPHSLFQGLRFLYRGSRQPQVQVEIRPLESLDKRSTKNAVPLFTYFHQELNRIAWIFSATPKYYVVDFRLSVRKKIMIVNKAYSKVWVYLPQEGRQLRWSLEDILYDSLQMVLIGYWADRGALLVHSAGLKDGNFKQGYIFAGKSGAGKSTTARTWHGQRGAQILNDDRILVQERAGAFLMFGTPWHGNFSDYAGTITGSAVLKKIFFIKHAASNSFSDLGAKDAFLALYPNIFPAFWDKKRLDQQINLCRRISLAVPSYRLGLVKGKSVVGFVRSIK